MAEIKTKLRLPLLPSYIRHDTGSRLLDEPPSVDVADLPDDVLSQIGQEWTEALLAHAAKRRQAREKDRG